MNIYYRINDDALYEQIRLSLDSAWGHTAPITCVDPTAVAPRDLQGRILLAVRPEFVAFDAVSSLLPDLLASGAVQQIDETTYSQSLQRPTP